MPSQTAGGVLHPAEWQEGIGPLVRLHRLLLTDFFFALRTEKYQRP